MKPLYIFRHIEYEGPGYLAQVLTHYDIPYRLIAIDQGELVPAHSRDAGGLVFMGGSMSVNDPLPWIEDELRLIREAQARNLPLLGHCLGGQLIAKALGGRIASNGAQEIGWHAVASVGTSPWLGNLPVHFEVFHWHGETYTLPNGATPLLRSAWCENQAFTMGRTLALQCHVEMTAPMVREWAEKNPQAISLPSASVQSDTQMCADLDARITALQAVADQLYGHWLAPLLKR